MISTRFGPRRFVALAMTVAAAGAVAITVVPATAEAAVTTSPVCQSNGLYPGGNTCIQLVATGYGNYQVVATGTTANALPSAWVTVTTPGGGTDTSTAVKVAAKGTVTYSSGIAAAAGQWCAKFLFKDPLLGLTWTATNNPAPCVTVPPLPAPPGSAKQTCVTANYPQFETCIDIVGGAVVGKGYATIGSAGGSITGYLTLTGPNGYSATGPTQTVVAGQTLTFTGPSPAAQGQWCTSFWANIPVLGFPVNTTGKTPLCITV